MPARPASIPSRSSSRAVHHFEKRDVWKVGPSLRIPPEFSAHVSAIEDEARIRLGAWDIVRTRLANFPASPVFRIHEALRECFELWLNHLTLASFIARLPGSELH